jgi:murein L,D-transpeptidase YcbB/YkuD
MDKAGESYSFKMKGLRSEMGVRMSSLLAFTAAVSLPLGSAFAQVAPAVAPRAPAQVQRPLLTAPMPVRPPVTRAAQTAPQAQPGAPVPGNPDYAPQQPEAAPPAPPLPPAVWDPVNARALYDYLTQVGRDGLNPADYDPEGFRLALASQNPALISKEATERFNLISSDLALGHIKKPGRTDWFVTDNDLDDAKQDTLLRAALAEHRVADALNGLLPTHPQYAALKAALAATPAGDTSKLDRIRLNMDRWRWLPRDLGDKYIIVNVPGFHATLVENGVNRWKQRAIAGKLSTPTPQLNAMATGVILNPWWEVPKSIEKEAAGKKGFVPVKGADGKIQRWRQPPGPTNALGQIKFVMPNSKAIYLHDTNARSRFNDQTRALSHGCVRTQHIIDLATELLGDDNGEWTEDKIKAALASKKTVQANFVKPVPVYIVYFSSAALLDGTIVDYKDLYSRDRTAMAALQMKDGGISLARKAAPKSDTKPAEKVATR